MGEAWRLPRRLPWRWLTAHDASLVKGMIARGDSLASIAKTIGVSRGRLAGIVSGDKFPHAPVSSQADLPPMA